MKIVEERDILTKKIQENGVLWFKETDIENGLALLSIQKKKKDILKLHINFRNKVLKQTHTRNDLFKFSCNGKQRSVTQLKQNLLVLIGVDKQSHSAHINDQLSHITLHPEILIGKKLRHRFQLGKELLWYIGIVMRMNSQLMEFEVQCEGEEDICWFTLLDDISSSGDLELL